MHTNPKDSQGTNLEKIAKHLNILDNVCFSDQTATYEQINVLHNISDVCLNISYAELTLNITLRLKTLIQDHV